MTFASRLTRSPDPYEPERGEEAAALFSELGAELRGLVAGTAGCSPYLKGLIEKERAWLGPALDGTPEDAFDALLDETRGLSDGDLKSGLRQAKRRVALLVALADLGGVWTLEEVTGALTRFADLATHRAMAATVGAEIARGKLPGAAEADAGTAGGMVAIAMGKMGAFELNYSSDIDLIVLFDSDRYDADDVQEARASLVRATRRMTALLSEMTGDGYVFRTDLRLRPDAAVTPVCLSMDAAEHYYEGVGRTWERAAYIKARAAAGDIAAGEGFLARLTPFVWRKHLDFAAIQDAHDMRLRIRAHKGFGKSITLEGHDMKLGAGGIREIEFFTQTRQIIAGGRDRSLRVRGTVEGLARLAEGGWVPAETAETLTRDYRAHREVEHRLQMIADAQTHDLPQEAEGFDRLAAFLGTSADALRSEISERLARVHETTEGFFKPQDRDAAPDVSPELREALDRWRSYPALRSTRAQEVFGRLKPVLLEKLGTAADPEAALSEFDNFLAGLPAGVQVFSLFEANPPLVDLIVDICTTAPALARYLGRNAQVFDAVIGGSFFEDWPGAEALTAELAGQLARVDDYERKLDAARRWAKEWHFRVGVHHLRGLIDGEAAGRQYAELAEAVLGALWDSVVAEFAAKHGAPPGRGAAVIGMGSLGAARLSATSDLDLIVIYDAEGDATSDGRRPLSARAYYARLTQALVTALTAPMAEGTLYEVDMRLRPSGRQGPVATSWAAFQSYQKTEAWTWEHLALTRARPVAGDAALGADVEAFRRALLAEERDRAKVLADVADMRRRLAAAKPAESGWEDKLGPGRMQEIELVAQAAALLAGVPARDAPEQLEAGAGCDWMPAERVEALAGAYRFLWSLRAAARLLTGGVLDDAALGAGGRAFVLRATGAESMDDLGTRLERRTAEAAAEIDAVLDGGQDG